MGRPFDAHTDTSKNQFFKYKKLILSILVEGIVSLSWFRSLIAGNN
jgi:hypothetical protein